MNLEKYGYDFTIRDLPLTDTEIEKILKKYESKIDSQTTRTGNELLIDLVGDYKIPDGNFHSSQFYTGIQSSDAIKIRKHILVTELKSIEEQENYRTLLQAWSSTFKDLVYVSKKL